MARHVVRFCNKVGVGRIEQAWINGAMVSGIAEMNDKRSTLHERAKQHASSFSIDRGGIRTTCIPLSVLLLEAGFAGLLETRGAKGSDSLRHGTGGTND